jgi:hypothetical protein
LPVFQSGNMAWAYRLWTRRNAQGASIRHGVSCVHGKIKERNVVSLAASRMHATTNQLFEQAAMT